MSDSTSEKKFIWERVSLSIGAVLVPVVVAYVGNSFATAVKNREVEGRFVELALNILQEDPTPETKALRGWAIDVVSEYSGVLIGEEARKSLLNVPLTPSQRVTSFGYEYDLNAPIIENGSFTWSQATHGNRIPQSQEVVDNIIELANVLQEAEEFLGRPIKIMSWYRPPNINARVGGASFSNHINGNAVDIEVEGITAQELYERLDPWWGNRGGLGIPPNSLNRVHLDTRGYKARWSLGTGSQDDSLRIEDDSPPSQTP